VIDVITHYDMYNPKAIFFDADNTLIDHRECEKQALIYLFNNMGMTYKSEYQDVFRPLDQKLWDCESYDGVPISREDIPVYRFKLFFEMINIVYHDHVKANDLFKIGLADSSALTENAEEIIEYLHDKGYILCVVTNGLTALQKPRVVNSKIGKFISHVIVSEEAGAHKPDPLIFYSMLNRLCLTSDDVIMVGDSLTNDIQGAKNAGIRAVWYNPGHAKNETDSVPDYEIDDLIQLKKLFL